MRSAGTVAFEERYDYLLHGRNSIFTKHLDESIGRLGVKVLKSPPRSPMANSICERVIGTIRRECLDWLIPLSESRFILKSWFAHYNNYNDRQPHMSLGARHSGFASCHEGPARRSSRSRLRAIERAGPRAARVPQPSVATLSSEAASSPRLTIGR